MIISKCYGREGWWSYDIDLGIKYTDSLEEQIDYAVKRCRPEAQILLSIPSEPLVGQSRDCEPVAYQVGGLLLLRDPQHAASLPEDSSPS